MKRKQGKRRPTRYRSPVLAANIKMIRCEVFAETQEQFGARFGVKENSVQRWENDDITPGLGHLVVIADLAEWTLDKLLGRKLMYRAP